MGGIKIVAVDGRTPQEKVKAILASYARGLDYCGRVMQNAIGSTVKRHFQTIYPGSSHYSPDKVTDGEVGSKSATVIIDVPGITRAYHNLDIRPVKAHKLSIPVAREAMLAGSPRNMQGLFYVKNAKGTEMLAKVEGGALAVMYILKDSVHQKKDSRLMPSDQTLATNVFARIYAYLQSRKI